MNDKAILRKQEQWKKQDKQALDNCVHALLQHQEGRAYLYWLLEIGRAIGQNPFTGNALTTSFECGQQNVGQQIMAHILEVAPDGFLKMLKEKQDERNRRTAESKPNGARTGSSSGTYPEPDSYAEPDPGTYA
jgi:hypothetical protein